MLRLPIRSVLVMVLLVTTSPLALAQGNDWSLSVGVPVNYQFTEDEQTGIAPAAQDPSGIRVMLGTPSGLGIGFAHYEAGFADQAIPWVGRDIAYDFLEFAFRVPFDPVFIGLGFGLGEAEFTPVRATFGPITQDFLPSDAQEWFVLAGWRFAPNWDAQVSFHVLKIDAEIETNGVSSQGDLGATLAALGAGYHF